MGVKKQIIGNFLVVQRIFYADDSLINNMP
jgi:hypothetical protein